MCKQARCEHRARNWCHSSHAHDVEASAPAHTAHAAPHTPTTALLPVEERAPFIQHDSSPGVARTDGAVRDVDALHDFVLAAGSQAPRAAAGSVHLHLAAGVADGDHVRVAVRDADGRVREAGRRHGRGLALRRDHDAQVVAGHNQESLARQVFDERPRLPPADAHALARKQVLHVTRLAVQYVVLAIVPQEHASRPVHHRLRHVRQVQFPLYTLGILAVSPVVKE